MKVKVKLFVFIASTFLLSACDTYEFPKSPFPGIETLSVTDVTTGRATLRANINDLGPSQITDHGFVWGTSQFLPTTAHNKIQLGPLSSAGEFESDLNSGLVAGKVYYVRAFVATADRNVYGVVVSFTAK